MDNKTIVLPSARAIRHEQLQEQQSTIFLPHYITMSDFISKLCVVDGYKYIDDDTRVLLLLEASDFKEFSSLQIERNFFTFTKNSSYIFKFFEELSAELYDINELSNADVYAEYEEHILILQELYKRYNKLCTQRKLLDRIFLPKLYSFNSQYVTMHKHITIYLEGYLTNFEFELLNHATHYTKIELVITASAFNSKMQERFKEYGVELEAGNCYTISLNNKNIIESHKVAQNKNIICESFSESLLQVGFIQQKIYEFVFQGYRPENIAVILPNEKFADILKSFDEKNNFNFAMGESFAKSTIYKKIDATLKLIDQDSKENEARLKRVGDELYMKLIALYKVNNSELDFVAFLNDIKAYFSNKSELKIFEEEIYNFSKLLPYVKEMNGKSLLNLFMQRIAARTIDDVRGGKVTVMGVLETRSVNFDAVVIVDFDEKNVPARSDKDMFLNTKIREIAKLPTMSDRENLQKHYYEMLINHSKAVALCFVSSSESRGSRFLKQLGIKEKNIHNELDYANILFHRTQKKVRVEEEIILDYSFKEIELSATRLKTYLSCKRKYYLKYIKQIKNHRIPKDMPQEYEIGNVVHLALKELYKKNSTYRSVKQLKKDLHKELDYACGKSELDKYLIAMQKKRMDLFCEKEVQKFNEGWSVYSCEESYKVEYAGMTLMGQIDRVDKRDNEIEVLDYKTGNYTLYNKNNFTEATDFQLEFYYLLTLGLGNVKGCAFYDLKESLIVPEAFLQEKLEILKSHIKDLLMVENVNFAKCEDLKNCLFCEYAIICRRA
jgi:ATP-dependent helicase/nuclease subunit B